MIAPANLSRITIPHLENGDLLSRAEFERRYRAMPGLKKTVSRLPKSRLNIPLIS